MASDNVLVRAQPERSHFADIVIQRFSEIFGLRVDQQVEGPRATEISHNDRPDWFRREERTPRRFDPCLKQGHRTSFVKSLEEKNDDLG